MCRQWRTGQGVSLPDGKWAPLNIRQYVKNVNDLLVAWKYNRRSNIITGCNRNLRCITILIKIFNKNPPFI
jgi:hypothetical protein